MTENVNAPRLMGEFHTVGRQPATALHLAAVRLFYHSLFRDQMLKINERRYSKRGKATNRRYGRWWGKKPQC